MKNPIINSKGNFKNFCGVAWKSSEEILGTFQGNFNEILQIRNLYKIFRKIV